MCRLLLRLVTAVFLLGGLLLIPAVACLWDADTIEAERREFPGLLELVCGKFLRHSREFYQWRIQDRMKRLASDPENPAIMDDIAVAFEKTGDHEKAIETALKLERLRPGRYETAANLATFLIHAGRPMEGLPYIDRALEINPNAHFGRERYQRLLVEYVMDRRANSPLRLPLADVEVGAGMIESDEDTYQITISNSFADHLRNAPGGPLVPDGFKEAVKGIAGMMKFGNHDSPILLEALGTLLLQREVDEDSKQLAIRAFLKASYEVPEGPARTAYRAMAAQAMHSIKRRSGGFSLRSIESDFAKELDDARAWYAKLREQEISWIRSARDPEAEFNRVYTREPELQMVQPELTAPSTRQPAAPASDSLFLIYVTGYVTGIVIVLGGALFLFRRRNARRTRASQGELNQLA